MFHEFVYYKWKKQNVCKFDSQVSSSYPAQLVAPLLHLAWVLQNGSSACSCKHNNSQLNINNRPQTCTAGCNLKTSSMCKHRHAKKRLKPLAILLDSYGCYSYCFIYMQRELQVKTFVLCVKSQNGLLFSLCSLLKSLLGTNKVWG